jgi:hypothetical protein
MSNFEKRIEKLEKRQTEDYQGNLGVLSFAYRIEHGSPPSPEAMKELEAQAKEEVAQGIVYSMAEILKRIDGKGLPRPKECGGSHERN